MSCREIALSVSVRDVLVVRCDFVHFNRRYVTHRVTQPEAKAPAHSARQHTSTYAHQPASAHFTNIHTLSVLHLFPCFSSGSVWRSFSCMWFPGSASLSPWCAWPPALPPCAARGHPGTQTTAPSTATCGPTCSSLNCSSLSAPTGPSTQ